MTDGKLTASFSISKPLLLPATADGTDIIFVESLFSLVILLLKDKLAKSIVLGSPFAETFPFYKD